MNEKKEIKISLTTFIVGIIAIVLLILVIVMGMYIATQNKGKSETENNQLKLEKNEEVISSNNIGKEEKTKNTSLEEIEIMTEQIQLKKNNTNNLKECTYYYEYTYEGDPKPSYEYVYNIEELDHIADLGTVEEQVKMSTEIDGYRLKYENGKYKICHTTGIDWYTKEKLAMKANIYYEIKNVPQNIVKILFKPNIGNGASTNMILMLDSKGNVYCVDFSTSDITNDFEVYKVKNLENIKNILVVNVGEVYNNELQGGYTEIFAKTNDGKIYKIDIDLDGAIRNLEPGTYLIEMTEKMEGENDYSDEGVTWNDEGQCCIYQGWGSTLIGTSYENGKELICNINKREDESGGYSETDVDITIKYRIIQNNTLELEEITINDDTEWKQEFPDTKLIWGASLKVGNVFKKVED